MSKESELFFKEMLIFYLQRVAIMKNQLIIMVKY